MLSGCGIVQRSVGLRAVFCLCYTNNIIEQAKTHKNQASLRGNTTIISQKLNKSNSGFTIVELLIVIVVIAILAAITIIAYNGLTAQAKESALKSDLGAAGKQLQVAKATTGDYPADTSGLKKSDTTTFGTYTHTTGDFCLDATVTGFDKVFNVTSGGVREGACGGGSGPVATTMQDFTPAQCSALTPYNNTTGTNGDIIELTDNRGGTTQTYEVARFGDVCWMIANLKLGSTTSDITLTPADSDVATNFTLPKLITSGAADYDNPRVYGPVPGDTGSGATNYGYLYNFSAATAGESRTSLAVHGVDAQYSVCPSGWRLPVGDITEGNDFSKLDQVLGGSGSLSQSGEANIGRWQSAGPFKGILSGVWTGSFAYQGDGVFLWSRSPSWISSDYAFNAYITPSAVLPGLNNYGNRNDGISVRCILR